MGPVCSSRVSVTARLYRLARNTTLGAGARACNTYTEGKPYTRIYPRSSKSSVECAECGARICVRVILEQERGRSSGGWNQGWREWGKTRERGIRGPRANRRPLERAGPHTGRVRGYSSSHSREISLSRARTLLAEFRERPSGIDSPGSIVIRDLADSSTLSERAGDLGGSATWILIAIIGARLESPRRKSVAETACTVAESTWHLL